MLVKPKLRRMMLESFSLVGEAKSDVAKWWNNLPSKTKAKVCTTLGLSKKDVKSFEKLSSSTKSEIEAYRMKYKGKIENKRFTQFKELSEKRKG